MTINESSSRREFLKKVAMVGAAAGIESIFDIGCTMLGSNFNPLTRPEELPEEGRVYLLSLIYDGTTEDTLRAFYDLAEQRYGKQNSQVILINNGGEAHLERFNSRKHSPKAEYILEDRILVNGCPKTDGTLDKQCILQQLRQIITPKDIVYAGSHGDPEHTENNITLNTPHDFDAATETLDSDRILSTTDLRPAHFFPLNCSANAKYGVVLPTGEGRQKFWSGISSKDVQVMTRIIIEKGPFAVFEPYHDKLQVRKEFIPYYFSKEISGFKQETRE